MAKLKVTERARRDLRDIGAYTEAVWGREQRVKYLAMLKDAFEGIVSRNLLGMDASKEREGYRKLHVGRHFIYYQRQSGDVVEIVRVLHDMMDSSERL